MEPVKGHASAYRLRAHAFRPARRELLAGEVTVPTHPPVWMTFLRALVRFTGSARKLLWSRGLTSETLGTQPEHVVMDLSPAPLDRRSCPLPAF